MDFEEGNDVFREGCTIGRLNLTESLLSWKGKNGADAWAMVGEAEKSNKASQARQGGRSDKCARWGGRDGRFARWRCERRGPPRVCDLGLARGCLVCPAALPAALH
jgi:hypothetical protein